MTRSLKPPMSSRLSLRAFRRNLVFLAIALTLLAVVCLVQKPDNLVSVVIVVVYTAAVALIFEMLRKRIRSQSHETQLVLAGTLGVMTLLAGALGFALAGWLGWLTPEDAMLFGVCCWLSATIVTLFCIGTARGSTRPYSVPAQIGALLVAVPFVFTGASTARADRPMYLTVVNTCAPDEMPPNGTIQYTMAHTTTGQDEATDWSKARAVAFVGGQGLEPILWPPILQADQVMERRYLLPGMTADAAPGRQSISGELVNALVRILTLGNDTPKRWDYQLQIVCQETVEKTTSYRY